MAEVNKVVEGKVKFRDGKKWKPRWCVMKKPSPVADRLEVVLFKDVKDAVKGGHPKSSFPLDGFYGLESGICFDKETSVLAIICQKQITLLAFESRETLIQFEIRIRRSLGEEHQFPVRTIKVPSHSKLPLDLVRMHIHGQKFCLTSCIPPKILCFWHISDLRRFGMLDGMFCFEGGSRCGKGAGFHVLCTDQAEEVAEIIQLASVGKTASSRRQTSKRRSEYVEPVKNVTSDNFFKNFQNAQVYGDQNFQEDTSWPRLKRHSISFSDYKHAKTYSEKQRLMSIENVEKERLMAIYDIPPRRVRKVESVRTDRKENSHNLYENRSQASGACFSAACSPWTGEYNNNVMSYQVPMSTTYQVPTATSYSTSDSSFSESSDVSTRQTPVPTTNLSTMSMSSSAPALCGYGNMLYANQNCSQSVPAQIDEEFERTVGVCQREEALEKLQQEEIDLHREMSLLDEILEVCQLEEGKGQRSSAQSRPPPLPQKKLGMRGFSVDSLNNAHRSLDNISVLSDSTYNRQPQSTTTTSVLLSPNLVSKMKRISSRSKASAPLPYVNLDRFDGKAGDENHVHVAGVSTSAPGCSGSWSSLQHMRSKGYDNVREENRQANKENKRLSYSLPGSRENVAQFGGQDLQFNSRVIRNEPIYANQRGNTPPPEVPPKGPKLLYKNRQKLLNMMASRPPPPPRPPEKQPAVRQDKYRLQYQSPRQGINPIDYQTKGEEDYFLMDNFAKEPKPSFESQHQASGGCIMEGPLVVNLPPKGPNSVRVDGDSTGCYMDMTGMFLEEVQGSEKGRNSAAVLVDSGQSQPVRPKYMRSHSASSVVSTKDVPDVQPPLPSKRSDSLSTAESSSDTAREPIRETNYMLMSSVLSPRKSVLESLQSLQTYVSTTPAAADTNRISSSESNLQRLVTEGVVQAPSSRQGQSQGQGHADSDKVSQDSVQKQNDSLAKETSETESVKAEKPEVPFANLLGFELHPDIAKPKSVQGVMSEEKLVPESSSKSAGFFTRLMRRNSKDRKSISQSQENLLSSASSESGLDRGLFREGMSLVLESSSSSESSRSQSQQELVNTTATPDRSRSLSFPDRSSYLAMNDSDNSSSSTGISILSQTSDLGATNSSLASSGTFSTGASNEGADHTDSCENILSDSEKSVSKEMLKGNYEKQSYCYAGSLKDTEKEDGERKEESCLKDSENCDSDTKPEDSESVETDTNKLLPDKCGGKVFTVLYVEDDPYLNSRKTDDEKLKDLWHSSQSLTSDKEDKESMVELKAKLDKESIAELKAKLTLPLDELSPDEKANAIARHISSLPPFVPPKMKSYPVRLSPVLERSGTPKTLEAQLEGTDMATGDGEDTADTPVNNPTLKKQQAKATLRITPPSEDEHGKIWIPRSASQPEDVSETPSEETKGTTLVVDLSDLGDQADALSISSLDSSCHGDETVRSSPASTILRPRSGKEYQKIERRRTTEDSCTTSPAMTPVSPASGSVFTFETPTASSSVSCYGELHSPKFAKLSQAEQASLSVSLKGENTISPKAMYMNIDLDMSPPDSPVPIAPPPPPEQIEPQLNYAEIDLSESSQGEVLRRPPVATSTKKSSKNAKSQQSENIVYAMIDMVATVAAQKAGKEHAANREDSLRRDRLSVSSTSNKERMGSLSLPPSRTDKKQTSSSLSQVSGSGDSSF